MKYLDLENWSRKQHFEHFINLKDPFFAVTVPIDITKIYETSKVTNASLFIMYLHACMKAINSIENFKYRIENDKILVHDVIHASATIAKEDHTFGFSFIHFDDDFQKFNHNFQKEKERVLNSTDLYPPINTQDCVYCSALPWFSFTSHKEPSSGDKNDSVPKLAFGKTFKENERLKMPVAIYAHHGLLDGYHVGLFFDEFQKQLDKND